MEKNFPVQGDRGTREERRPRARVRKARAVEVRRGGQGGQSLSPAPGRPQLPQVWIPFVMEGALG